MRSLITAAALGMFALTFAAAPAFAGEACCAKKADAQACKVCKCEDCKKSCGETCKCAKEAPKTEAK